MEPLAVSWLALALALGSLCITLWRTRNSTTDTDFEELADQVGRLAKRARADTMRRVRAEAGAPQGDDPAAISIPPELRKGLQPAPGPLNKDDIRRRLLGH